MQVNKVICGKNNSTPSNFKNDDTISKKCISIVSDKEIKMMR
jgi:hypothetical protein